MPCRCGDGSFPLSLGQSCIVICDVLSIWFVHIRLTKALFNTGKILYKIFVICRLDSYEMGAAAELHSSPSPTFIIQYLQHLTTFSIACELGNK